MGFEWSSEVPGVGGEARGMSAAGQNLCAPGQVEVPRAYGEGFG